MMGRRTGTGVLKHAALRSHRSRGLKYSKTSPNDRDGKRSDLLSVKARGCITSGLAASQTRGAQRASRAMRWTGTQAHTQVSTHVKWAGVQCRQGKGARDIRTGRETYYYVVRHILLAHLASLHPCLLTYLLASYSRLLLLYFLLVTHSSYL